jgi:ribosomal-protein-alanine N-acetyltransferase
MNVVIETDRLLLRAFTEDDAPLLYRLNLDPEVTLYTHDPMTNLEQAKKVLNEVILPQYALYNYGRWAVHLKPDVEFMGWCGLKCMPETLPAGRQGNEIDLGYRFMKKFWGKGYATEAAFACIQYGFTRLDLQQIIGRALTGNLASIKVLEKCGMKYLVEEYVHGYLHKTYQATNPAIKS